MTRRANDIIAALSRDGAVGAVDPLVVARTLRRHGLLSSETGWVLHRVFGISMPEAVHRAAEALAEGPVRVVSLGTVLPSEALRDDSGLVHFGRR